jgi:uncharacterized lipoprotein YbaY/heat shock protein HslJ/uncharacterized lipoprotein NlpE involved in copper resistance
MAALALGLGLALSACSHGGHVTGSATYLERIALPPGAVFEARLEDVSRSDVPAVVINNAVITDPGNPPFSFSIPFSGKQINRRHSYAVRGTIRVDGRLIMATDQHYPVITRGMPRAAALFLKPVRQTVPPAGEGASKGPPLPDHFTGAHGLRLPATYEGVLPCGDCPGIRWHLNLMPDQTFYLKLEYLERNGYFEDSGRWRLELPERRLVLSGRGGTRDRFAIDGQMLSKLDANGNSLPSSMNSTLERAADFSWIDISNPMRGIYEPGPGGGTLTDCVSGHTYPVAGNIQLLTRASEGGPMMLDLKAQITRPEGHEEAVLKPLDVLRLRPGEGCEQHRAAAPLTNTYWRLVELDGEPVRTMEGGREPHIMLRPEGNQFSATVGCNQMGGTYTLNGDAISFSRMRTTMMACQGPAADLENRFQRWFTRAAKWRLNGQSLTITATDDSTALFEAAYFD